jgi:hypothetical protein
MISFYMNFMAMESRVNVNGCLVAQKLQLTIYFMHRTIINHCIDAVVEKSYPGESSPVHKRTTSYPT